MKSSNRSYLNLYCRNLWFPDFDFRFPMTVFDMTGGEVFFIIIIFYLYLFFFELASNFDMHSSFHAVPTTHARTNQASGGPRIEYSTKGQQAHPHPSTTPALMAGRSGWSQCPVQVQPFPRQQRSTSWVRVRPACSTTLIQHSHSLSPWIED